MTDEVAVCTAAEGLIERVEQRVAPLRPEREVGRTDLDAAHLRYFAIRDQAQRLRELCKQSREQREAVVQQLGAGASVSALARAYRTSRQTILRAKDANRSA